MRPTTALEETRADRASILLVEDNMSDVHTILRGFRGGRIGIRHVRTGAAAIDLAERERFLAVLLDHRLPDIPGIKVCRQLRHAGLEIPIFILSAVADDGLGEAAMQAGATDYLIKDIVLPTLGEFFEQRLTLA